MFVDKATILVRAGQGGNGRVSFRKEKYVDRGGPDGGDGGRGGSIIFVASRNQNTLASFRYEKERVAEPGQSGGSRRKAGRGGRDLTIAVPVGTEVTDQAGQLVADLAIDGQTVVVAKGGKGGFGNAHFISSTRQAPRVAEKGEPGESHSLQLELKMIADVGLVGLPNAGKSTLLSVISNARPEIADYPFTTLTPNLGVVDIDSSNSLLFADIPGLIEGAAAGKGLGDEFLRHVERTAVLVHLIDAYQDDIAAAYKTIQHELQAYKIDLSKRPQLVVVSKVDGLDDEIIADLIAQVQKIVPKDGKVMAISAASKQGLSELIHAAQAIVEAERAKQASVAAEQTQPDIPVLTLGNDDEAWSVTKREASFVVRGTKIDRFAARTDFANPAGVDRLRDIMRRSGIMHELVRQGIAPGDSIRFENGQEITY